MFQNVFRSAHSCCKAGSRWSRVLRGHTMHVEILADETSATNRQTPRLPVRPSVCLSISLFAPSAWLAGSLFVRMFVCLPFYLGMGTGWGSWQRILNRYNRCYGVSHDHWSCHRSSTAPTRRWGEAQRFGCGSKPAGSHFGW